MRAMTIRMTYQEAHTWTATSILTACSGPVLASVLASTWAVLATSGYADLQRDERSWCNQTSKTHESRLWALPQPHQILTGLLCTMQTATAIL